MKKTFMLLLSTMIALPAISQSASLEGGTPDSACECYDKGFLFGTYNYTPRNSAQSETMQFKCGLKGFQQAFDQGLSEGYKDYLFSQGVYDQGTGEGLCPYSNY